MEERIEDYIKRIESIIQTLSEHIEFEDYDEDVLKEASEDKEALESMLKRYKELEEENESLVRQYEYQGALMVNEYFSKEQVFKLFIPISVIQNKKSKLDEEISEIRKVNRLDNNATKYDYLLIGKRDMLQELLEERNK